jgi:DNA replication protein DnaC
MTTDQTTLQEPMMRKKTDSPAGASGASELSGTDNDALHAQLSDLRLPFTLANYVAHAQSAADKQCSHVQFLQELIAGEAAARADRRVERLVAQARFPVLKTLERFDWAWPTKINRMVIQNLFHLDFVRQRSNVVFIAGTGLGKSHLMTALGHAACLAGHSVLFTGAIEIINTLTLAHTMGSMKTAMAHYVKPQVLCIDELGYLPIDKFGADCLFQIISHRYEQGATLFTTNRVYKQWAGIFNNDAVLTSALLDRVTHHAQTVLIEGKSYRSRDQVEL